MIPLSQKLAALATWAGLPALLFIAAIGAWGCGEGEPPLTPRAVDDMGIGNADACTLAECAPDADTAEIDAETMHYGPFPIAPRVRMRINGRSALGGVVESIVDVGPGLLAEAQDGDVVVDALRNARGDSSVTVAIAGGERVALSVIVASRSWAFVGSVPHEASLPAALDPVQGTSSEAWSIVDGVVFGTREIDGNARAVRMAPGAPPEELALPVDATESWARHTSDGSVWGAIKIGSARIPASFASTGEVTAVPFPVDAAYYAARGTRRVGATWEGDVARAVRCDGSTYASCRSIAPVGASSSSARAIDAIGRVFGCATTDGVSRAFVHTEEDGTSLLSYPPRGCISGAHDDGRLVGELEENNEISGVVLEVAGGPAHVVRVGRSWGTRLLGASSSSLLGAVRDERGIFNALRLDPVELPPNVTYGLAPEPVDPHLAHACGHLLGPFAEIAASVVAESAGIISRTHTNYGVYRPQPDLVQRVRLSNPREGRVTFHTSALFGITLLAPSGEVVPAHYMDFTSRCSGLRGFVQYALDEVGTYVVEIAPTTDDDVRIVYERTWVVSD